MKSKPTKFVVDAVLTVDKDNALRKWVREWIEATLEKEAKREGWKLKARVRSVDKD